MSTNDFVHHPAPDESRVGAANIERLLSQAYHPEAADADFVQQVEAQLGAAARDLARSKARTDGASPAAVAGTISPTGSEARQLRQRLVWAMGAAAAVAGIALFLHAVQKPAALTEAVQRLEKHTEKLAKVPEDPEIGIAPDVVGFEHLPTQGPSERFNPARLTAKRRPALPVTPPVAVGSAIATKGGERRRITLPDGSVLYLNQNTAVKLDAERHVTLAAGEVFVEVTPHEQAGNRATFVVQTAKREVSALGTKFAVRTDDTGTGVLVTQGKVKVNGIETPILSGQQLAPDSDKQTPAPRASHVLDWTKELMTAAESPLVPGSQYSGGALIAVDPYGQQAKLSLRKMHVDVYIQDGFARTTIDQTYFNNDPWRMEGTFYFPLPPDASLSRLAMYVSDGQVCNLMEGGMAERDYARNVYEQIIYSMRDPALLEWVDGSTFKMRVFPLEGRQEKRILLSYTQRLPSLYGHTHYRFPAGHSLDLVRDWSFHAAVRDGGKLSYSSDSHELKSRKEGNDLILDAKESLIKADRDVALDLYDETALTEEVARFASAEHEGARYLMLRYRPSLPASPQRERRDWVFLFEASGDRDPLLARVQIDVIRTLLANAEHDDTFTVLAAATRVHSFAPEPVLATPHNVQAAIEFLEGTHLIGALDLKRALATAQPFLKAGSNPYLVHVGSGIAAMGERREDVLARRIPVGARYVGVGIGKRWSRSFMKTAAERTGGYFTQINPDEPISWRAFELSATLNTPRLMDVKVVADGGRTAPVFLNYANSLAQGEEFCSIARIESKDASLPESVTITGKLDGNDYSRSVPVGDVAPQADYLPRTWAKLEIDRLLAEDGTKNKDKIVALSKAMYVMTPFTSLLVLENEAMYQQYKVDRGRKDHWAMYNCPAKIPIVYEPLPGEPVDPRGAPKNVNPKPTTNQVLQTIVLRGSPHMLNGDNNEFGRPVLSKISSKRQMFKNIEDLGVNSDLLYDTYSLSERSGVPRPFGADDGTYAWYMDGSVRAVSASGMYVPGGISGRSGATRLKLLKDGGGEKLGNIRSLTFSPDGRALVRDGEQPVRLWDVSSGRFLGDLDFDSTSLGYYLPAQALVVNGTSLVHSRLTGSMGTSNAPFNVLGGAGTNQLQALEGRIETRRRVFEEWLYERDNAPTLAEADEGERSMSAASAWGTLPYRNRAKANDLAPNYFPGIIPAHPGSSAAQSSPPSLLYHRPSFTGDERIFFDLVAYAPGMTAGDADLQAVLEAEALPPHRVQLGSIDPAARKLIDQARAAGWQRLTIPGEKDQAAFTIVFDGAGRYVYERSLAPGLRERVVCDGKTLVHLYPDLGIGAKRTVSRFHRAALTDLVPWALPPVEDLNRDADVTCLDARTVVIAPHGIDSAKQADGKVEAPRYACIHLIFAADGRLAERRIVEMPSRKTLYRETYGANGGVKVFDAKDKEVAAYHWTLSAAGEADLKPDTKNLVVLPLPFRTRDQVRQALKLENKGYPDLTENEALALFAAEFAAQNAGEVQQIFRQRFHTRNIRPLGFYTLMAACGVNVDTDDAALNVLAEHGREPLGKYLAYHSNPALRRHLELSQIGGPRDSFLQSLAEFRVLSMSWTSGKVTAADEAARQEEQQRVLDFVRRHKASALGWSLLTTVADRAGDDKPFRLSLADAYQPFEALPGLAYAARYERGRNLLHGGHRQQAQTVFRELYEKTLKDGALPPIDQDFRMALQPEGTEANPWGDLMRRTTATLIGQKRRLAVISLAWQCWQIGDQPTAGSLITAALQRPAGESQRVVTTLAAIRFLAQTQQIVQADSLLQSLLTNPTYARWPSLWRLSAHFAGQRGMTARSRSALEQALELEFQQLPEVINLQAVRADYGALLAHYQQVVEATATLQMPLPPDFAAKVIRAADRWRALDREGPACEVTAKILQSLGARDLAWDYRTTPVGLYPNEAAPWLTLAQTLRGEGELAQADHAYTAAFAAEPTNAQILWDRAQNLQQAGKQAEAQKIYRRLADGQWQPRFNGLQAQARWQLTAGD
jgi:tetratricopeptide (TPR) repeat protein